MCKTGMTKSIYASRINVGRRINVGTSSTRCGNLFSIGIDTEINVESGKT